MNDRYWPIANRHFRPKAAFGGWENQPRSLYAYEANAGIQLKRDREQTNVDTVKEYPYIPYQAVVVAIDGRMARMRTNAAARLCEQRLSISGYGATDDFRL